MDALADDLLREPVFAVARGHLGGARITGTRLNLLWNSMRAEQPFSAWIDSPEPHLRELWGAFDPDYDLKQEADEAVAAFLHGIKAALDVCVHAAPTIVYRPIGMVEPEVYHLPLLASPVGVRCSTGSGTATRPAEAIPQVSLYEDFTAASFAGDLPRDAQILARHAGPAPLSTATAPEETSTNTACTSTPPASLASDERPPSGGSRVAFRRI